MTTGDPCNPLTYITGPPSPGDPVIATADEDYKRAVAREFAHQLVIERRRAILHKIYLVEVFVTASCILVGVVVLGSNGGNIAVLRTISLAGMMAMAVTAIVQVIIASHPANQYIKC
ncbi:MAG: hypothetical protein LBG75_03570 [Candidatus Nomurabacteria bacterium]|nr:hypothetical protein [Candidatus Nomurabacteria bacterium]